MQYPNLKEIERRPKRYRNADGVPDLVMGAIWIIWSAALILPELLPPGNWRSYYWMVFPLILVLSGLAGNWVTKKLKQHLTFPRTGYVEWRGPGIATRMLTAFLGAGSAAGIVLLARYGITHGLMDLAAPAVALLFAVAYLLAALWHKLPHLLYLSALSLVLAGVIARARMNLGHGLIMLFMSLGVLWCVVGGIRLRTYLRQNPPQQEGEA